MAVGAGMTFVVQSSSVFTSAMTPLVGRWPPFSAGVCFSCEGKEKGEGAQLGSLKKVEVYSEMLTDSVKSSHKNGSCTSVVQDKKLRSPRQLSFRLEMKKAVAPLKD